MSSAPKAATDTMGLRPVPGVTAAILPLQSAQLMTLRATRILVPDIQTLIAEVAIGLTSTRSEVEVC